VWLLGKYRSLRRKQQYRQYNRIYQTNIQSDDASLKACYGNGVSIADTVIVSSDVTIGKYSYVNPHSTLENCTVGNYCSISAGVNICPGEHDLYAISTHPLFARDEMPKPILRSDVLKFEDLKEGMILTGTVRNVIDFGAFVDIGVKHDGLVHISELSDRYIKNPMDVVSVGDIVKVRVIKVDMEKMKVSLSMKNCNES